MNPRHIYGHWLLTQRYGLVQEDGQGLLQITKAGRGFLEVPGGEAEALVDESEGLSKLLSIVADTGPSRAGGILEEWADYLRRRSAIRSESMIKETMRRRLSNLVARGLVERKGTLYSATPDGLLYLQAAGAEDPAAAGDHSEVWALVRQHENTVRDSLRRQLQDMDPFAFEHLIKRLLEEMDYQNVEVTSRASDGGVDVIADIEVGITTVREVVQAKRHRRAIQRKDLDALRGSLYRFNAVRGTIVTTSRFSRGTQNAAFATGVAPITLVDGEKLVDLIIEHGIGVRKRPIVLLEVDADAIAAIEKTVERCPRIAWQGCSASRELRPTTSYRSLCSSREGGFAFAAPSAFGPEGRAVTERRDMLEDVPVREPRLWSYPGLVDTFGLSSPV